MGLDAFGLEQHVRLVDDPLDPLVAQIGRSHAIALSGFCSSRYPSEEFTTFGRSRRFRLGRFVDELNGLVRRLYFSVPISDDASNTFAHCTSFGTVIEPVDRKTDEITTSLLAYECLAFGRHVGGSHFHGVRPAREATAEGVYPRRAIEYGGACKDLVL